MKSDFNLSDSSLHQHLCIPNFPPKKNNVKKKSVLKNENRKIWKIIAFVNCRLYQENAK